MTKIRERKYLGVLFALALALAGCKGESPTAPSSGGGTPGGGGVTPPTSAAVTLTVSNATPLVDSTSVVTATVTQGNNPVPNGTAVEFSTNLGVFAETGTNTALRTTTGGATSVTLTSATPGTATVTAVVANISRTANVTFSARPVTPVPPDLTPAITAVSPAFGRPQGGQTVIIAGRNFRAPARVLFDFGNGLVKEAFVVSVTPTQIEVLTPPVDLGTGQTRNANISVIVEAGTATEARANAATPFVYQAEVLTPKVNAVSPASGPPNGGTRVTLFGEGFQAPLQVFFGAAEAQVVNVTFSQIIVVTPDSRATSPAGSETVTGPVDIRVININSATQTSLPAGFRYTPGMQITAVGPTEGLYTGGTRVQIDGVGFDDPIAVTIGGVAAQPIRVSGTQIIAITSPIQVDSCGDKTGPIVVTNVETGVSTQGGTFTYRVPKPVITSVTPTTTPGGAISITVLNAGSFPRLTIDGSTINITAASPNPDGTTTFTGVVPSTITLDTRNCTGVTGAAAPIPTSFDIEYTSQSSGCNTSLANAVTLTPPNVARPFFATLPATYTGVAGSGAVSAQFGVLTNIGTAPLTAVATTAGPGCSQFTLSSLPAVIDQCQPATLTATYTPSAAAAAHSCSVTVTPSVGTPQTFLLQGTTTAPPAP